MCINSWRQCQSLSEKSAAANLELMGIQLSLLDPCRVICHAGHVCHGSLLGCCSSFCCLRLASQQSFPLALPQLTVQLLILCLHQLTLPFDLQQGNNTTQTLSLQVAVACSGGEHLKSAVCVLTSSQASSVTGTDCFWIALVATWGQSSMLQKPGKYATDNMNLTMTCGHMQHVCRAKFLV